MISPEVQVSIELAQHEAIQRRHSIVTLEHLLFALLHDPETMEVLRHSGAHIEELREQLLDYLEHELDSTPDDETMELSISLAFQRAIRRAILHVQGSSMEAVKGFNVLIAMYAEAESFAKYFLESNEVNRLDVVSYLSHGVSRASDVPARRLPAFERGDENPETASSTDGPPSLESKSMVDTYCENLNERAKQGGIDPLIGRKAEVNRIIHVLSRRRKNNPILVGDSGVGKTAIAEGLARKIVEGKVPKALDGTILYSLDLGSMLAGTKYRGDFEERMKGVVQELVKRPEAVLFIDEIHTIVRAGATEGGTMDASNLLKPALQSGALRCIGSTTYTEYRKHFEHDRALARRFQKVEVPEPSIPDTVKILHGLKSEYEEYHGVRFTAGALRTAAELSAKHLRDLRLPDKAIDLVDEAGAANRLKPASRRKETVGPRQIRQVLSTMARIPTTEVDKQDRVALQHIEKDLKQVVFGQAKAVEELSVAIKLARAGIGAEERPVGSFMFTGPTGVGKTELAKQLAILLGIELLRFDMSEYMERHTVSRLVGAPPGYVGFDQGGLLTEAVTKNPHCVLLLDEIEKAHPDVFNILLQVMDHGTLTDNNGRTADFRNVVLIMTSNVGAREVARGGIGFARQSGHGDDTQAYKRAFSPEFRNRIDAKITFDPLNEATMLRIVDKFMDELGDQLERKKVRLEVTDAARKYLAETGFEPAYGARPLARTIKSELKQKLADELLFGCLADGGAVRVDAVDGALTFDYNAT